MDNEPLEKADGAAKSQVTDGTPRAGCVFFFIPVAFAAAIIVGYVIVFGFGARGGTAEGERVRMTFDTCPDAHALIQARAEMMGLADPAFTPVEGGLQVTARLPGTVADATVPQTLARAGDLRIVAGDDRDGTVIVGPEGLAAADPSLKVSLTGLTNPLVVVELTELAHRDLEAHMEAHIDEQISVWIDDELIMVRPNDPPFRRTTFDLDATGDDPGQRSLQATDWGIVLTHGPLPCPTTVRDVSPAG